MDYRKTCQPCTGHSHHPHTYMVKATGLDSQRHGNIEITEVLPTIDPDTEQAEPVSASVFVTQKGLNEFAEGNGEDVKVTSRSK